MLKQKIKHLLIGTMVGTLLTSSVAFAANPIKLIVDGREVVSETKPIMYQNSVYVPVRTVSEALGVNVQWDSGSNSVIIDSENIDAIDTTNINNNVSVNNEDNIIETTYNGLKAIKIDGNIYFNAKDYNDKIYTQPNSKNRLSYNNETKNTTIYLNNKEYIINHSQENVKIYKHQTYFHIKFYQDIN